MEKTNTCNALGKQFEIINKSIAVEEEIIKVIGKLIERLEAKRGPLPCMVYKNDIDISNIIKNGLIARKSDAQKQYDIIQSEIVGLRHKKEGRPEGMTDAEFFIYSNINLWSKDTLIKVDIISQSILAAISSGSAPVIDGIKCNNNKAIYASVAALHRAVDEQFGSVMTLDSQQKSGRRDVETAEDMSITFIWFVAEVFRNSSVAKDFYQTDRILIKLFTSQNINSFGLPKALRTLLDKPP